MSLVILIRYSFRKSRVIFLHQLDSIQSQNNICCSWTLLCLLSGLNKSCKSLSSFQEKLKRHLISITRNVSPSVTSIFSSLFQVTYLFYSPVCFCLAFSLFLLVTSFDKHEFLFFLVPFIFVIIPVCYHFVVLLSL